jgi:hypothetical protein
MNSQLMLFRGIFHYFEDHVTHNLLSLCDVSGFRRGVIEVFALMGFYAVLFGSSPTFREG